MTTSSTRSAPCRCAGRWSSRTARSCSSAAGGADQITACAQYANENGIPYLSAGVNEDGLADLETYFATSLTYAEQAPLIVAQLQEQGLTEAALVVADTPSFEDAYEAYQGGADRGRDRNPLREPDQQGRLAGGIGHRGPAAEGLRRPGRRPPGVAGRLRPRADPRRREPELRPGVDRPRRHQRPQHRRGHRLSQRGDRRVLLADASAGRRGRDRSRLQPRVRPVRRRAPPPTTSGSSCGRSTRRSP